MVVAKVLNLCPGWLRNGTIFLVYAYSLSYNLKYVTERGEGVLEYRGYGGKFKYMTFWCFVSLLCICWLVFVNLHVWHESRKMLTLSVGQ